MRKTLLVPTIGGLMCKKHFIEASIFDHSDTPKVEKEFNETAKAYKQGCDICNIERQIKRADKKYGYEVEKMFPSFLCFKPYDCSNCECKKYLKTLNRYVCEKGVANGWTYGDEF